MPGKKMKRQPKSSKNYHHGDLKSVLIETAVAMLKTVSAESLSLRELARSAGVSQAAPYRHFPDKDALLAAISQQGFDLKYGFMKEAMELHKDNPLEMYFACAQAYFQMGHQYPQHFSLMVSGRVIPNPKYPELLNSAKRTFLLVRDMVIACQRSGIIGDGDPYHYAIHCWSIVNGFTALYAEGRLEWVGVTKENAPKALRTLVSSTLNGARMPLKKSDFGFKPFQTSFSAPYKKLMEELREA